MAEIKITNGKGIHFIFDNGVTASIQFGPGNYGSNYNMPFLVGGKINILDKLEKEGEFSATTVEVAAWRGNREEWLTDKFIDCGKDTVAGYITPDKVVDFLRAARDYAFV